MREVAIDAAAMSSEAGSFVACVATILELPLDAVPVPGAGEPIPGWRISRWLGGLGLGLVPIANAKAFAWPGPWIAWVRGGQRPEEPSARAVIMFGNPAGVVFDPAAVTGGDWQIESGFVIAAQDIALARPPRPQAPTSVGEIAAIWISASAGASARAATAATALAGRGLDGDRHVAGTGTFPSNVPGSALTLIEAEVCESFEPALGPDEHRRNIVTRGIALDRLVGHEFMVGAVRCRGVRPCEPCVVIQRYASRPILRSLVHRGGVRADILEDGVIHIGDRVRAIT